MSSFSTKILTTHSNKTFWKIQLSWKFLKQLLQGMVIYIYIHLKKWYLLNIANSRLGLNLMSNSIKSLALQWKISSILDFKTLPTTGASICLQWLMNQMWPSLYRKAIFRSQETLINLLWEIRNSQSCQYQSSQVRRKRNILYL